MEVPASLVCSKVTTPFTSSFYPNRNLISFRTFNKHTECKNLSAKISPASNKLKLIRTPLKCSFGFLSNNGNQFGSNSVFSPLSSGNTRVIHPIRLLKCSYSSTTAPSDSYSENTLLKSLKNLSFESLKSSISQLNPVNICKWSLILSVAIAASKWTASLLVNPFFWMYFSWTWLFWPWTVAITLTIYGAYSLNRHIKGESTLIEQLSIVTSAFTWLTLVPPAHFNGFLEGWPFVFFFVYHYFFFLNVSVRKRLYGDYYTREHDPKWDITLPNWQKLFFCIGVFVAHWLAAFEGTELHLIPGGWNNLGIWVLIASTIFMQYHSTLYLAKYSEKVVVPTAVVQFGPYRFIRHPIYASTMLMFVTYFAALRSPLSALFIAAVCVLYYGQKAKLEEQLMLESFGESYSEYMRRVKYKLIPFVY